MNNTIKELIDYGVKELQNSDTALLDARLILSKVIKKDKLFIIVNRDYKLESNQKTEYLQLIDQRKKNKPVKYIIGECDFMGLDFYIEEGVLIPRSDTEVLVQEVLKYIDESQQLKVCDLCTGSGAIAISLAYYRKNIKVDAVDYFEKPEKVTKINIEKHNLKERVTFIESDLLSEVIKKGKKYDILVSNPPYIKRVEIEKLMNDVKDYEPGEALNGGEDGLYFYRKIISQSKEVLVKNGILAFEIGYDQGEQVRNLMDNSNFEDAYVVKDLAGLDRVVIGKLIN